MGQVVYLYTATWFHVFINKRASFLLFIVFDILIICNPKGLITSWSKNT